MIKIPNPTIKKYFSVFLASTLLLPSLIVLFNIPPRLVKAAGGGFSHSLPITIDHTKVSGSTQSNFPVLISGTYSYLRTTANNGNVTNASGYDIGFYTNSDCSTGKMAWETESYSATTGAVNYWVKVPTLSHTTDTVFYICYGNSNITTDQSAASSVWDSNYSNVWHLHTTTDSKGGNTLTNTGATFENVSSGNGAVFSSTSNKLVMASPLSLGSDFSVEFWAMTTGNVNQGVVLTNGSATTQYFGFLYGGNYFEIHNGTAKRFSSATTFSTLKHYVVTQTGSNLVLYVNGVPVQTLTAFASPVPLNQFGNYVNLSYGLVGKLDEARVSTVARSADWIATQYANQSSPSTFYNLGGGAAVQGTWTQTDWSDGTASGITTTNPTTTYESKSIDAIDADGGRVTLDTSEQFTNTGFESDLSGWSVPYSSKSRSVFGQFAYIADADALSFGDGNADQPFSISGWVKRGGGNSVWLPSKVSSYHGAAPPIEYALTVGNHTLNFNLYDTTPTCCSYLQAAYTIPSATFVYKWIHVVGTYDGSSTGAGLKIYLNGSLVASGGKVGAYGAMSNTTAILDIGGFQYSYIGSGVIDDYSLWGKELSPAEVSELYNNGKPKNLSLVSMFNSIRAWWKLGDLPDGSSGAVYDSVGPYNSYSANLGGLGYTNVPGNSNYSIDLDGSDEYAVIPDANNLSFNTGGADQEFTLSGWAYMDDATNFVLFSKGTNTIREYSFDTMGGAGDRLRLTLQSPDGSTYIGAYTTDTITAYQGKWVHVAATYSGTESSSGIKLYLNGNELATTSEDLGNYLGMSPGTGTAKIGNMFGNAYYANGKLDDITLWNKQLSQSEINEIIATGSPESLRTHSAYSNLVSWWDFNNAYTDISAAYNIATIYDSKGSNNGTLTNTETTDLVYTSPNPMVTQDTSVKYSASAASAKIQNTSIAEFEFTQDVNVGDTEDYNLTVYAYTDGAEVSSSDVVLYADGDALDTEYTSVGSGWYRLSATIEGTNTSIPYGAQIKSGKTVYLDNFGLSTFYAEETLTSNIFSIDGFGLWGDVLYNTESTYSVSLGGTNEYIQFADVPAYSFGSGGFTLSGWVKLPTMSGWVFTKYANGGGNEWSMSFNNGTLQFYMYGGGYIYRTSTNSLASYANSWVHLAVSYDGSGTYNGIKLFANGEEIPSSGALGGTFTQMTDSATPVRLAFAPASSYTYTIGHYDDFSIWGERLSAEQIAEIYASGSPADLTAHSAYADLASWWTMGDNALDNLTGGTGIVRDEMGASHGVPMNTEAEDKVAVTAEDNTPTIKIRTGSRDDMTDAIDWEICDPVTSGDDISTNNCVDDYDKYIQYQVVFSSEDDLNSQALSNISIDYELGEGIAVGSFGSQTEAVQVPSVDNNMGGGFTFTSGAEATITSITLSLGDGTTVAETDITDIELYLKEQGTCSINSIPYPNSLFDTVDSFSGGIATFNGTFPLGTTQLCAYVRYDIEGTASGDEVIEIEITDPSTQVVITDQTVTPATPVQVEGFTTLGEASSESSNILEVTAGNCNTRFYSEGGILKMEEMAADPDPCPSGVYNLTSDKVSVSSLTFTELTSNGGMKAILIEMILTDNVSGDRQEFSVEQTFSTSVTLRQSS